MLVCDKQNLKNTYTMKKVLFSAVAFFSGIVASFAQPTLTGATNNPVAGDVFTRRYCDTLGVSGPGAAGASVTWNFSTLAVDTTDTVYYMSCLSTPMCDSFTGSNVVYFSDSSYVYGVADAAGFRGIGTYDASSGVTHFVKPLSLAFWPMTYNATHKDTGEIFISSFGLTLRLMDTSTVDGYGTLMLPGNTYTNVLRLHATETVMDSMFFGGPIVNFSSTEKYSWFRAGFHNPIMTMTIDTAGTGTPYVSEVIYYKPKSTVAVKDVNNSAASLKVYPNPASENVHIMFDVADKNAAAVTITDVTGRILDTIANDQLRNGANDIAYNVSNLAGGMYIIKLQDGINTTAQRFVVTK